MTQMLCTIPTTAASDGRGLIDDGLELATKVGIPIPDGDTAKMTKAADAWNGLATHDSIRNLTTELERAAVMFEQVTSPDANFIDEDLRELKTVAADLAGAYGEIAQSCREQKTAHDNLRTELEKLLNQLATEIAIEVAVNLALTVLASCVSFGVGGAAVAAKTAASVAKIIDKFVDLIKTAIKLKKLQIAVKVEKITEKSKATLARIKDLTKRLTDKSRNLPKRNGTQPSGTPNPGAKPSGTRTKVPEKEIPENQRALNRENESAETLAQSGYKIEQNPSVPGNKNPDYKIEGEVFDNVAPTTGNVRNIASRIEEKVTDGQTERVVVNLADSSADPAALKKQLTDWPIDGLKEVIVIDKQGNVVPIYP